MQNLVHHAFPCVVLTALALPGLAQHTASWTAGSGLQPDETVPALVKLQDLTCGSAGATLAGGLLTVDTSGCASDYVSFGGYLPTPLTLPATLWVEGRCRVVSSLHADPDFGPAHVAVSLPAACPWILWIEEGELVLSWATQIGARVVADTSSALRTYRLEVDTTTHAASVFVDGALALSAPFPAMPGCFTPGILQPSVAFGNSFQNGGVVEWESLTHNLYTGEAQFCPPSGVAPPPPGTTPWGPALTWSGSRAVAQNDVTLMCSGVPTGAPGYFLTGRRYGPPRAVAATSGYLCLDGPIGRFVGPGQVLVGSPSGQVELTLDLSRMPTPSGLVAAQPGESWNFQLWFRDVNALTTSTFSGALNLVFE